MESQTLMLWRVERNVKDSTLFCDYVIAKDAERACQIAKRWDEDDRESLTVVAVPGLPCGVLCEREWFEELEDMGGFMEDAKPKSEVIIGSVSDAYEDCEECYGPDYYEECKGCTGSGIFREARGDYCKELWDNGKRQPIVGCSGGCHWYLILPAMPRPALLCHAQPSRIRSCPALQVNYNLTREFVKFRALLNDVAVPGLPSGALCERGCFGKGNRELRER